MSLKSASVSSGLCLCRAHTEFKYEIRIGRGVVHILPKGGVVITPRQLHITVFVPNYVMRTRVETKTPLYLTKHKLPILGQEMLDGACPGRPMKTETPSRRPILLSEHLHSALPSPLHNSGTSRYQKARNTASFNAKITTA